MANRSTTRRVALRVRRSVLDGGRETAVSRRRRGATTPRYVPAANAYRRSTRREIMRVSEPIRLERLDSGRWVATDEETGATGEGETWADALEAVDDAMARHTSGAADASQSADESRPEDG